MKVQVSTLLPITRYFVVSDDGKRVVGSVYGHTTEQAARDEIKDLEA